MKHSWRCLFVFGQYDIKVCIDKTIAHIIIVFACCSTSEPKCNDVTMLTKEVNILNIVGKVTSQMFPVI